MNAGAQLILHSVRRHRVLVLSMSLVLAGFQLLLVFAARTLESSSSFSMFTALIPDFVRQIMGESVVSLLSFGGMISLGYFHLAVVGALVGLAIALGVEPAGEIESRFADLVMSRPIARHWPVTRSIVLLVAGIGVALLFMRIGTWLGLHWMASAANRDAVLKTSGLMAWNLGAVVLCWGTVALAVACASRRRGVAGAVSGLLALVSYLLDYVARVWTPAHGLGRFSLFRYYSALDVLVSGSLPARSMLVLVSVSVCAGALAYVAYSRRDL
jgi:ABC-2 type transport system permease protein